MNKAKGYTGLIQVVRPGGKLTLSYTGTPLEIHQEEQAEIRGILDRFATDCQMMIAWFACIMNSQEVMQSHLKETAKQGEPFTVRSVRPDGKVIDILAQIPVDEVTAAMSESGEFERLR